MTFSKMLTICGILDAPCHHTFLIKQATGWCAWGSVYHETAALLMLQSDWVGFGSSLELPVILGRSPDTPTYCEGGGTASRQKMTCV